MTNHFIELDLIEIEMNILLSLPKILQQRRYFYMCFLSLGLSLVSVIHHIKGINFFGHFGLTFSSTILSFGPEITSRNLEETNFRSSALNRFFWTNSL